MNVSRTDAWESVVRRRFVLMWKPGALVQLGLRVVDEATSPCELSHPRDS